MERERKCMFCPELVPMDAVMAARHLLTCPRATAEAREVAADTLQRRLRSSEPGADPSRPPVLKEIVREGEVRTFGDFLLDRGADPMTVPEILSASTGGRL